MHRRSPSFLRALLLLMVALGPLQAQTVFACLTMDAIVHNECCCEHYQSAELCTNPECDSTLESSTPCCERSVEIGVDEVGGRGAISAKQADMRFDADPPPALLSSLDGFLPPVSLPIHGTFHRLPAGGEYGSSTWLVTRRLRI